MKELTQKEFEEQIQRLIDGSIGRKKLAKELETDIRTLNNKIMELSSTNSDLYAQVIEKIPYKPKEINTDIEGLAVTIIKNGLQQTMEDTGFNKMTISRKMKKLKTLNPGLHKLYVTRNEKMSVIEREKFLRELEKYDRDFGEIRKDDVGIKREQIQKELDEFEALLASGLSKDDAARKLGYKDYTPIWRRYKELERIKTEEKSKQGIRERVKVEVKPLEILEPVERRARTENEKGEK